MRLIPEYGGDLYKKSNFLLTNVYIIVYNSIWRNVVKKLDSRI